MTRSVLLLMFTTLVLAACNPFGLRDSDDERIQLVADMTDAVENEDWDEVRSYLNPELRDLSDSAIRTAVWESVLLTTYSPSEWVIDDYEDWSLVRYPEDAPSGTVVREIDGDWFVDPGQYRLTLGRLAEQVSHEFHVHGYEVTPLDSMVLASGNGTLPASALSVSVLSIERNGDNAVDLAMSLTLERGGTRSEIGLEDIQWHTAEASGTGEIVWSSAPLTEDHSALNMPIPENFSRGRVLFDVSLSDVPEETSDVTLTIEGLFIDGINDPDAEAREFEVQIVFEPENTPDFANPDDIPWPIEMRYADMPFNVLVPTHIPFEYNAPSTLSDSRNDAVAVYMNPPEPQYVRIVQRAASGDDFTSDGELIEVEGLGEAFFLDDGEQSRLSWVNEDAGVEVVIETGDGDDRQPLEELIRIAEGMQ